VAGNVTADPIKFARLRVVLDGGGRPWAVPVDYYRALRAAVYKLLDEADPHLAEFLHGSGFTGEAPAVDLRRTRDLPAGTRRADEGQGAAGPATETFKLFCFSSLIGKGTLHRGQLVFDRPVIWLFATPLRLVAEALGRALRQTGTMSIGQVDVKVADLNRLEQPSVDRPLACILLSPLVISATSPAAPVATPPASQHGVDDAAAVPPEPQDRTDAAPGAGGSAQRLGRQRRYLTRDDDIGLTEARLRNNLLAKHRALYGVEPADAEFAFSWTTAAGGWPVPDRPTRLVRLSAPGEPPVSVRGSLGAVRLAGSPELLRIALHTGLGQYNASGMGFVLPEAETHLVKHE
jgi:CRISPR/Cas system endoribonuclease Cas6 (RAMP superfamily)